MSPSREGARKENQREIPKRKTLLSEGKKWAGRTILATGVALGGYETGRQTGYDHGFEEGKKTIAAKVETSKQPPITESRERNPLEERAEQFYFELKAIIEELENREANANFLMDEGELSTPEGAKKFLEQRKVLMLATFTDHYVRLSNIIEETERDLRKTKRFGEIVEELDEIFGYVEVKDLTAAERKGLYNELYNEFQSLKKK